MKYRLGDICTITKGVTGIMKAIPGAYTMIALGEADKTHNEYQFDSKAVIIPLVSSTGHGHASMKRVKYFEGKFALGNILCAVTPNDESFVLAKYLHIYLHWNREELLVSQMKGMANVSLPMNRIADVTVTVPSIEKQFEIVELEKKLVEKELEADKLFANQLIQLENLNQAILQEAVQGKLIEQDPDDEPGSELLKRIKAEKAQSGKKEKPLPPIKPEEIPFAIPENWVWCRLGDLRDFRFTLSYGVLVPGNEVPDGITFVRVQDLDFADKGLQPSKRISPAIEKQFAKTRLVGGEILICVVGSIGKVALSPNNWIGANIARAVCRFMPNSNLDRKYIYYCLVSPFIQNFFLNGQKSINPTLNVNILETTLIPLPPLSEQKRIAAEIEKQLAKTKQLKEHTITNQQTTEQLLKALLHQAFEVKEMEEVNS